MVDRKEKIELWIIIGVVVAIILSIISLVLILEIRSNQNKINNNINDRLQQTFDLAVGKLDRGDYQKFYQSLLDYNNCITEGIRNLASDIKTDNPRWDVNFIDRRKQCDDKLHIG